MRRARRLLWVSTLLPLMSGACGAGGASQPPGDAAAHDVGLRACTGDNDCPDGQSCVAGYCHGAASDAAADAAGDSAGLPQMSVTPTLLDFGNPIMGEEYQRVVTVTNAGGGVLTVTAVNLLQAGDGGSGAFTLQGPTPPFTLDAGAAVALTVVLRLTDDVIPTGTLKIHSDDPSPATADATVDLAAYAKGSALLGVCVRDPLAPADGGAGSGCLVGGDGSPQLQFGTVPYGTSVVRVVELTNAGDGNLPVKVLSAALADGTAGYLAVRVFTVAGGVETPATLPTYLSIGDPGATPPLAPTVLHVQVTFTALIEGSVPANALDVASDLATSPAVIPAVAQVVGCRPAADDGGVVPDGGADPQSDPANCGSCGHACATAHATPTCVAGACVLACAPGWDDCDGDVTTGCETDLDNTTDHCGRCGTKCLPLNGATECRAGVCHPTCAGTFGDCDGDPTNGCETDLSSSPSHCGACGTACVNPNGSALCTASQCTPTCASGWQLCGGDPALGCLVHTAVDVNNCGTCGHVCTNSGGSVSCADGACQPGCAGGYADCDGNTANGCEATILTDPSRCGGCTNACSSNHVPGPTCTAGGCSGACAGGYADCNHDKLTDGCEVSLLSDAANCSACGHACANPNGTVACVAGACAPGCAPGWDVCTGDPNVGCLVHTALDPHNCGSCGTVCTNTGGSVSCAAGTCQPSCDAIHADCDGNPVNGCEATILTDPDHCGGCGGHCSSNHIATRTCTTGTCTGTCAAGYADCNGDKLTDGCETNVGGDPQNCGGCGQDTCQTTAPPAACSANTVVTYSAPGTCTSGACAYPSSVKVCPNGGGCFNAQCTSAPTFEGAAVAFIAFAGTQVYPPDNGSSSTTLGTDFYVETTPKGSEKAVHLFYALNNNFTSGSGTDLVMSFYQWIGSNDQWKATIPAQPSGTTVYWYIRFDHYDGSTGYYSNFGANFSYRCN